MTPTTNQSALIHSKQIKLKFYLEKSKDNFLASLSLTTVFILLVRKANAKGSVSGFEIAPPSKGGGSDKQLAVN